MNETVFVTVVYEKPVMTSLDVFLCRRNSWIVKHATNISKQFAVL